MKNSVNQHQQRAWYEQVLFYGYLCLLVLVPLPLGAIYTPGWAFAVVGINVLMFAWLLLWASGRVVITPVFRRAWPMWLLWLFWLAWLSLQIVPLPLGLLETLSPMAAELHVDASQILHGNTPDAATISLDTHATVSGLIKSIAYVACFALALLLVDSRQRVKILAWTIVLSGVLQALYGSLMTMSGAETINSYGRVVDLGGIVTGTFINRNHLAGYLVICLSVGIGLMLGLLRRHQDEHWKARVRGWIQILLSEKFRLRLLLVMMVIALVMTRSRMGNISFMVGLLIASVMGLLFLQYGRRGLSILVASIIVIDVVVIGAWFGIDKVMDRLEEAVVETKPEESTAMRAGVEILETDIQLGEDHIALLQDRGLVYRDMEKYIPDYWLTGSGLGTFRHIFPNYRGSHIRHYHNHAHNDYYEFTAETGIPGILILGGIILWPLITAIQTMMRRRDQLAGSMAFAVVMSLTALLLHSTVDFNLQIPANAMTFMVVLALAFIAKTLPSRRSRS